MSSPMDRRGSGWAEALYTGTVGVSSWTRSVRRRGKPIDKVVLRTDEKGGVVGGPSGRVRLVLELWRKRASFGVIGTSALPSGADSVWDFILQPVRCDVNLVLKVTSFVLSSACRIRGGSGCYCTPSRTLFAKGVSALRLLIRSVSWGW